MPTGWCCRPATPSPPSPARTPIGPGARLLPPLGRGRSWSPTGRSNPRRAGRRRGRHRLKVDHVTIDRCRRTLADLKQVKIEIDDKDLTRILKELEGRHPGLDQVAAAETLAEAKGFRAGGRGIAPKGACSRHRLSCTRRSRANESDTLETFHMILILRLASPTRSTAQFSTDHLCRSVSQRTDRPLSFCILPLD
jgi:hypothetical protein